MTGHLRPGCAAFAVWGALALASSGCGQPSAAPAPAAASSPAEQTSTGISIDAKTRASITVAAVREKDVATVLLLGGKVQFDEDRVSHVLVPLSGQVVDLHARLGDSVKKGQSLCAITSREATAAVGEHAESHKDLDLAEKNAAMTEDLFDHQAASKIALQQAENDLAKARSRVARDDQALRLLGLRNEDEMASFTGRVPIVSPIAGIVIERKVTDGQFVQSDSTPIVTVADLSLVWIVGDVFERDLRRVKMGAPATVTAAAYPAERFRGRVNYISDSIDPATRTAKVRVSVPNPGNRLKPEMFASVSLDVAEKARALTVPSSAVFSEDGRSFVYVEVASGRFERRAIETADAETAERRILSGLRAGERVVVDGALLLRQEEEKRAG